MSYFFWLIVTVILVITVPVLWMAIGHFLRRRDFKRQIEGRRPERKAKENMRLPDENPDPNAAMDMDRLRFEAQMKQNRRGWH